MRLLGLDFETTGLDTANDRVVEVGAVLWDVEKSTPLVTLNYFVYNVSYPVIPIEASKVNGISQEMLLEFGVEPLMVFGFLEDFCKRHKPDYMVAHNAENFDKPMLISELLRLNPSSDYEALRSIPWIDTRQDIPFPVEPTSRKLNHLAADHGFINPFQHRALFDVLTMLRVLSDYDMNTVVEYSKTPFVTLQAQVSYDDRQLAKEARFSWEAIGDKRYPKMWVKRVKANLLEQEKAKWKFQVKILE